MLSQMLTTETKKILVIRSANVHQTTRTLEYLSGKFPDAKITLLLPRQQMEYLSCNPHIDRLYIYDKTDGGAWKGVIRLIRELREERFDLVVTLCPSPFKVAHLYDVILFSLFIPAMRRIVIDGELQEADLSMGQRLRALIDGAALVLLSAIARLGTHLLLLLWPEPPREREDGTARGSRKSGRIGVLVPVLPDMSHTFVYREILAMIGQGADFDVIALEEGDYGVLHAEASELLKKAIIVPKISRGMYMLYYLAFLLTSPRRMAGLIQLYRPYSRGDKLLFLRFDQFHEPLHPIQSFGLARLVKKRGISYIHAYGSTYPATRAMVAASLLKIPFSISTFVDFDRESDFRMLHEKLRGAAFVVATTDYCASRLISMTSEEFRHKIHTVVLGIDPEYGIDCVQRSAATSRLILSIGRLVEKKGFDYLLKSLVLLKARGLFPKCVLIGDGPEKGKLQAFVEEFALGDSVTFAGALPNEKVLEYLGPENILVAPSVYADDGERDGIPTVLIEALICEMAVVSTRISGIPELIEDQGNGILVPARDEKAIADAIQELLENPGLRREYGLRGAEKVRAEFNVYKSSRKLWSLITQHCADSNCGSNRQVNTVPTLSCRPGIRAFYTHAIKRTRVVYWFRYGLVRTCLA